MNLELLKPWRRSARCSSSREPRSPQSTSSVKCASNQITALTEIRASQETPQFVRATHFVYSELPAKMQDPAFRYQVANRTARTAEFNGMISDAEIVGNSYENIGVLAKTGLVDRQHLLDIHSQL